MTLKIEHPNVLATWTTLDFSNGGMVTVIVVETNLPLNSGDAGFDQNAVHTLWKEAIRQTLSRGYRADAIRLVGAKLECQERPKEKNALQA